MVDEKECYPMMGGDGEMVPNEISMLKYTEAGERMTGVAAVRYLVLHCSATRVTQDYTEVQLMRDHRARGFRTVGYHYYIRKDGAVQQFRGILEVGAHARPYNRCSIGICYEGGLDAAGKPADTRTPEQTEQIRLLLQELLKMFPKAEICGHRDLRGTTPKECPCFDAAAVFGFLKQG